MTGDLWPSCQNFRRTSNTSESERRRAQSTYFQYIPIWFWCHFWFFWCRPRSPWPSYQDRIPIYSHFSKYPAYLWQIGFAGRRSSPINLLRILCCKFPTWLAKCYFEGLACSGKDYLFEHRFPGPSFHSFFAEKAHLVPHRQRPAHPVYCAERCFLGHPPYWISGRPWNSSVHISFYCPVWAARICPTSSSSICSISNSTLSFFHSGLSAIFGIQVFSWIEMLRNPAAFGARTPRNWCQVGHTAFWPAGFGAPQSAYTPIFQKEQIAVVGVIGETPWPMFSWSQHFWGLCAPFGLSGRKWRGRGRPLLGAWCHSDGPANQQYAPWWNTQFQAYHRWLPGFLADCNLALFARWMRRTFGAKSSSHLHFCPHFLPIILVSSSPRLSRHRMSPFPKYSLRHLWNL